MLNASQPTPAIRDLGNWPGASPVAPEVEAPANTASAPASDEVDAAQADYARALKQAQADVLRLGREVTQLELDIEARKKALKLARKREKDARQCLAQLEAAKPEYLPLFDRHRQAAETVTDTNAK